MRIESAARPCLKTPSERPIMDRYSTRTFDPHMGAGSSLVATFDGSRPASSVALSREEREFFDDHGKREIRAIMSQRSAVRL